MITELRAYRLNYADTYGRVGFLVGALDGFLVGCLVGLRDGLRDGPIVG